MNDHKETQEWLTKAEHDFEGAVDLSRRRKKPLPDLVCYHCQQAAEKYLKSILIFNAKAFPKTHDLIILLEMCLQFSSGLEMHRELFEILNPYSAQFRYPGEEVRQEEARGAVKAMKEIRTIVRTLFPPDVL